MPTGYPKGGSTSITVKLPHKYIAYKTGATYYAQDENNIVTSAAALHTLLATLNGTVYIKGIDLTLSNQIDITAMNGLHLIGDGPEKTIITCTMATTNVGLFTTSRSSGYAAHIHLTVDSAVNTKSVTLTDASSIVAGDWIKIASNHLHDSGYAGGGHIGEIVRVLSVAGNVLTLDRNLIDTYEVAVDAAWVIKLTFNIGFSMEGIKFIGPNNSVDNTLVWSYLLRNVSFKNCHFRNFGLDCIRLIDCLDVTFDNCTFEKNFMDAEGYTIAILNCSDNVNITNCNFREYGRHYIALSTDGNATQTEAREGGCRNVHVNNCHFEGCIGGTGEAINTHHGSYGPLNVSNCSFLDNDKAAEVVNCESTWAGNDFRNCVTLGFRNNVGVQNTRQTTITGNNFYDTTLRASQSGMSIVGNNFYGLSRVQIIAGPSSANPDIANIIVKGNIFDTCNSDSNIQVYGTTANEIFYITIEGNIFKYPATVAVELAFCRYIKVIGNICHHPTTYFITAFGNAAGKYVDTVQIKDNSIDNSASYVFNVIGATNIEISGNTLSNCTGRGISLVTAKDAATPVIIRNNNLNTTGAKLYSDDSYTNIITDKVICPFVKELGTAAWISTTYNGIDVDAAAEGGMTFGHIPYTGHLHMIKVWGIIQAAPGAGNGMQLTIEAEGSKVGEAYNAEVIAITKNNSILNPTIGNRVSWVLTATDDTDLDDIMDDEGIQIAVLYAIASGANIATDLCLQYAELFYI